MQLEVKRLISTCLITTALAVPLVIGKVKSAKAHEIHSEPAEYEVQLEVETEYIPVNSIINLEYKHAPKWKPYSFINLNEDLQKELKAFCDKQQIEYELILAVIKTESDFEWVIGDNGEATGYMQIWKRWWGDFADKYELNIDDETENLKTGTLIIKHLIIKNNGDIGKALTEYNTGEPNETSPYHQEVMKNYKWVTDNADQSTNSNP